MAGLEREVDPAKHQPVLAVAKFDVAKVHPALPYLDGLAVAAAFLRHFEQPKSAQERDHVPLDGGVEPGEVVHRRVDAVEVNHEHHHVAGRQLVLERAHAAHAQDNSLGAVDQKVLNERVARFDSAAAQVSAEGVAHDRGGPVGLVVLVAMRAHGLDASDHLLDAARHAVPERVIVLQVRLQVAGHLQRDQQINDHRRQHHQRKLQVHRKHDDDDGGGGEKLRPHFLSDRGVEGRHLVRLVDLPRDRSRRPLGEIGVGQAQHVPEGLQDEILFDVVRGVCGKQVSRRCEKFGKQRGGQQHQHSQPQGAHGVGDGPRRENGGGRGRLGSLLEALLDLLPQTMQPAAARLPGFGGARRAFLRALGSIGGGEWWLGRAPCGGGC